MTTSTDASRSGAVLDTMVRRFMSPGVVSLPADSTLRDACRAMTRHGVHAVVVVDRASRPIGLVTSAGIVARRGHDLDVRPAGLEMDEEIVLVSPTATAAAAAELLDRPGVTHLLVAGSPGVAPEGVVTVHDITRLLA